MAVAAAVLVGGQWWLCKNFSGKKCSIFASKLSGLSRDLDCQGLDNQGTFPPD